MKLKCGNKKCEYEWDYKGKSKFYATCPRCLNKVRVKKEEKQNGRKSKNNTVRTFSITQK